MCSTVAVSVRVALVALAFALPASAGAAEITADGVNCTLAEAIVSANADSAAGNGCTDGSGADVIVLDANAVLSAADPASTNMEGGAAGLPDVTSTITLRAGTATTLFRDSADCLVEDATAFRLLNVRAGGALTLDGIVLMNGCIAPPPGVAGSGGAVLVEGAGTLTTIGGAFSGNRVRGGRAGAGTAASGRGGAVAALGGSALAIEGTSFLDNGARGGRGSTSTGSAEGGAVFAEGSSVSIHGNRWQGNSAVGGSCIGNCAGGLGFGGALRLVSSDGFDVSDAVLSNNLAEGGASDGFAGSAFGGAIAIQDSDGGVLERLELSANIATGGASAVDTGGAANGGALSVLNSDGPLVADSWFAFNQATAMGSSGAAGGGAFLIHASAQVRGCSFMSNRADGRIGDPAPPASGGAVMITGNVPAAIVNSTFFDNVAEGGDHEGAGNGANGLGGALYAATDLTLAHDTFDFNGAEGGSGPAGVGSGLGGSLYVLAGPVTMSNTLVVGGTASNGGAFPTPMDCFDATGALVSSGYNHVEAPLACTFAAAGDRTGADVAVGVQQLGDHGCATPLPDGFCPMTIPLGAGSPAIDGGSCATSGETADARGVARPRDHAAVADVDDGCDVGAFELHPGGFHTLSPCRVFDTRLVGHAPALSHLVPRSIDLAECGVPESASAVAVNVTATEPTAGGHLVLYPGGGALPPTSTINFSAGQTRANNAVLAVAADGSGTLDVQATMSTGATVHLIVDVSGYFE